MPGAPATRSRVRATAQVALAAALLGAAPVGAAQQDEPPASAFAPSDPVAPEVPSSSPAPARAGWREPVVVRPHVEIGFQAGGGRVGLGLAAGLRIHPVIVAYSLSIVGTDDEYMTFSGVKIGYQHTISRSWAAYGAVGIGSAGFSPGPDGAARSGSAAVLDLGFTVGSERSMNALSFGVEVLAPSAPSTVGSIGDDAVVFTFAVNPLMLLVGKMGGVR
jgi:hypothetical protein